jgi:prepilin-type N-terminal cleavage/methylation domain-containing protein
MKKFKLGFTLIELLIVIALLGTLAVALLAALDPLEQIKKGNDTGVRNTVSEIQGAFLRYYAIKGGKMPWGDTGTMGWGTIGTLTTGSLYQYMQSLVDAGELKSDFGTLAGDNLSKIYMTGFTTSSDSKVAVCYIPTSKSFKTDISTKWGTGNGGTVPAGTGCNTATSSCYWCAQ